MGGPRPGPTGPRPKDGTVFITQVFEQLSFSMIFSILTF